MIYLAYFFMIAASLTTCIPIAIQVASIFSERLRQATFDPTGLALIAVYWLAAAVCIGFASL